MVIPATIISTVLGALTGYSMSLWRFRGDTIVFAIVIMGVFLPEQMKLIPWALVLRDLGLSNTIGGAGADPYRAGHELHHAVLPQLLSSASRRI